MLTLSAAGYRLVLSPEIGGAIARFDWRGLPLMRPACGTSVLEQACFPLVPFSNRIANGRFASGDRTFGLPPNRPTLDPHHTLHGYGWLATWTGEACGARAVLRHRHETGAWPWRYDAEQTFDLTDGGLVHTLEVRNRGADPMPTGLGFHPYFPRDATTTYLGLHSGEWTTGRDGLPLAFERRTDAIDWWRGEPIGSRTVDTVYAGRGGPLLLSWPERHLRLRIEPDATLAYTVVYAPAEREFFCVEPVSHPTDAINRDEHRATLRWLASDEAMTVAVRYVAEEG